MTSGEWRGVSLICNPSSVIRNLSSVIHPSIKSAPPGLFLDRAFSLLLKVGPSGAEQ